ncbi:MAG: hypothetical protein NTV11_07300 [Rhodocyclales bacterium]|nr:hypothetical protein [Rhodocyclales bacterium]
MRRPSPLIVIICALFLLGAQQAAYAHWIGHIGSAASTTSAPDGDGDYGDAPSHACMSCAAFAALNATPPSSVSPIAVAHATAIPFPDIPTAYIPAHSALPYTARAPPAVL